MNSSEVYRIIEKSYSAEDATDRMLSEMRIRGLLVEKIDEKDFKSVRGAIQKARSQIDDQLALFSELGLTKENINLTYQYAEDLKSALETAENDITNLQGDNTLQDFAPDTVTDFFNKKLTLPQIMRASMSIYSKTKDFSSVAQVIDVIKDNLMPMLKDADKTQALSAQAGQNGIPDLQKLTNGMKKAVNSKLKQTVSSKISKLFNLGKEKEIMNFIPKTDMNQIGNEIVAALLEIPISNFEKNINFPPSLDDSSGQLNDIAKELSSDQADVDGQAGESVDKDTEEAEEKATAIAKAIGRNTISAKELTQILKGLPGLTGKRKDSRKSNLTFRKAINKAAGRQVFEESYNRWTALAGIKETK